MYTDRARLTQRSPVTGLFLAWSESRAVASYPGGRSIGRHARLPFGLKRCIESVTVPIGSRLARQFTRMLALAISDARLLGAALGHRLAESLDGASMHPLLAEVLAGDVDVSPLLRARERDVCVLAVGLPATGEHERAIDRAALRLVDVLRVGKAQFRELARIEFTSRSCGPFVWIEPQSSPETSTTLPSVPFSTRCWRAGRAQR